MSKHLTSPVGKREYENSVMLEYNPASLDNRFPTFRDNTMSPSSGVEVRSLKMRPLRYLKISEPDYPEKKNSQLQICKNHETRISDMYRVSKSIRKTPCIWSHCCTIQYSHMKNRLILVPRMWIRNYVSLYTIYNFTESRLPQGEVGGLCSLLQMFKEVRVV